MAATERFCTGACPGISQPPTLWHTGPGTRLKPGDPIWWVCALDWPSYAVRTGSFITLIAQRRPEQVARVVTTTSERHPHEEVPFSRLFVSKQDAEAEAAILRAFALQQPKPWPRTRAEPHHRSFTRQRLPSR